MKALIIGNNDLIQSQLKEILAKADERILIQQVFSSKDAKNVFLTFSPDKIFLDLTIYEEGILMLLKMFKTLNHSVKVTCMVSSPGAQFKKKCLRMGADDFFDRSSIHMLMDCTCEKRIKSKASIFL